MGVDVVVSPRTIISPQSGPQEQFLATNADIAIYGGAAGGGKTFALLLCPLRHVKIPTFGGVIFRRTSPQITNEGALWDEATSLYMPTGATPVSGDKYFRFPSKATISFSHLQHEDTKYDWQGSQIPYIGFDELTHFTKGQFFYMMSRNRSACGVRPYIRATTNPDCDSWVAELIAWWINQDTGLPIEERSGVIRYFVRIGDELKFADTAEELDAEYPGLSPKSITFISAKLTDNQVLMKTDPGYMANLMAMPTVERERLLHGNWKVRHGHSFFDISCMLQDGEPVPYPDKCDGVFAVIDTAMKDGAQHDGTAVSFFAMNAMYGTPLILLDWDVVSIEGASLDAWLPGVFDRLEELARETNARTGSMGAWIEDRQSGTILLQQALNRGWNARPLPETLTAAGKTGRALNVSQDVYSGKLKLSAYAYHKVSVFKGASRNHWLAQVGGFNLDAKQGTADDLLDTMTYGVAIALGGSEGYA